MYASRCFPSHTMVVRVLAGLPPLNLFMHVSYTLTEPGSGMHYCQVLFDAQVWDAMLVVAAD